MSKGYFGKLSDLSGRRVPFVQIGYAFSAVSKPMMAVFIYPLWIFLARTIDRFGKGIRTGARDALLSDEATQETKGKVFGFHRSMDTLGAVLGPSLALIYLYFYPQDYRTLFFIAFIPGLFAISASFYLKDKKADEPKQKTLPSLFSFLNYWSVSPTNYKKVVTGLLVFTLFNSSDIFLLLKAKESGIDDTMIIGVYIFYNLIYALSAFPIGIIADRVGIKTIFVIGLALFATVYFGMSVNTNRYLFFGLFFSGMASMPQQQKEFQKRGFQSSPTKKRYRNSNRDIFRTSKYLHYVGKFADRTDLVSVRCDNSIHNNSGCHFMCDDLLSDNF